MQSTGQTSTHELSLVPMQGSAMTYAMWSSCSFQARRAPHDNRPWWAARGQVRSTRGHHLADARAARQAPGEAARERPRPRPAGPVPDRSVRRVILLTGATGNIGSAVLRRLTARGERVRCLVRDPRRLGAERVRVQIALGDLSDPSSFRNALRGVDTVVHLAAAIRDQPRASIEELNAIATYRLVRAAERAHAKRFVYFSAIGASLHQRSRFFQAKALAERAVDES